MNVRYRTFLSKLRQNGFQLSCNWSIDHDGSVIEHYTVVNPNTRKFVNVIFHSHGVVGFDHYIESQLTNMDECVAEIESLITSV